MTEENKVAPTAEPSGEPEDRDEETLSLSSLSSRSVEVFTGEMEVPVGAGEGRKPASTNHAGGDRLGRYELVRVLGQGAFAEVWLAMEDGEHGFRKRVALKILKRDVTDDETYEALLHEARVCGHLHHGNIVDVYGVGQEAGTTFIAMEFIDGIPLDVIIKRARKQDLRLPLSVIVDLGMQVSAALDHAHNAKDHVGEPLRLVHRDLKPSNIIISVDGVAKVTDFGLAKTTTSTQETESGMLRGTPSYVAPEVWLGTREFSPAVDLFALGAILWEMAAGEMLFTGELPAIIGAAINGSVDSDLQRLRLHHPELTEVVSGLLRRKPEERTQAARDVKDSLAIVAALHPGPGGLSLFMRLAEALLDPEITLDNATARTASTGDRDWRRFAARVSGENIDLTVTELPSLNSLVHRDEAGPTRSQMSSVRTTAPSEDGATPSTSRSTENSTSSRQTVVGEAPAEGQRVWHDLTQPKAPSWIAWAFGLSCLLVLLGAAFLLLPGGDSATSSPPEERPPAAVEVAEVPAGLSSREGRFGRPYGAERAASPDPAEEDALAEGAEVVTEEVSVVAEEEAPSGESAGQDSVANESPVEGAPSKNSVAADSDLVARGRPTADVVVAPPASPKARSGDACIRVAFGGQGFWLSGGTLTEFASKKKVYRYASGSYELTYGIRKDEFQAGSITLTAGKTYELNCDRSGGGCRVQPIPEPCAAK